MTNLTTSIKHFASLNRAPGATWTEATKRKAPHKPILLLAGLDLVARGVIPVTRPTTTTSTARSGRARRHHLTDYRRRRRSD